MVSQNPTDIAPASASSAAGGAPKRDRRKRLTRIDRRTALGLRVAELTRLFAGASSDLGMTPIRKTRIAEAAEQKAVAELARGQYLRGEGVTLDDVVRAERLAERAVRALRIVDAKPKPLSPLAAHFARPVRSAAP